MIHLNAMGLLCSLGNGVAEIADSIRLMQNSSYDRSVLFQERAGQQTAPVRADLPKIPDSLRKFRCYNNQLALAALLQIEAAVDSAIQQYGADRLGVVMGSSTASIDATGEAVAQWIQDRTYPDGFHAVQGTMGGLSQFVRAVTGAESVAFTVSTACSSGANALLASRRLIRSGVCDAVLCGVADSLCDMTLQGFASLDAVSSDLCRPFTAQRDGINIGEGAAFFLLSREATGPAFLGGACTSDAHHFSAPDPTGKGALRAMQLALEDADLDSSEIDYLNLHGTGTEQNDSMESLAVHNLFADQTPCGSSKSYTGHTLGAAAAIELGLCAILLDNPGLALPPDIAGLEGADPTLPAIRLTQFNNHPDPLKYVMSNSFAFGGNNVSLVIGTAYD